MRAIIMTVVLAFASPASATIIDLGDFTRITTTGLDWLNVTETQDLSYDEVVVGSFYSLGWRHATVPEWCDLVQGLGASSGWMMFPGPSSSSCGALPPPGFNSNAFVNFDDDAFGVDWPLFQSYFGITQDMFRTIGTLDYGPGGDPFASDPVRAPRASFHDLQLVQNLD